MRREIDAIFKEQQELRVAAIAEEETLEDSPSRNAKLAKSARAYAKTYETGPPLVPAIVVDRIEYYTTKFKISKRRQTLEMISRYWSLKREARRGAPLLKRLHLEPWTANTGGKAQTEEEKHMKLDQLEHLLYDLEMLQELTLAARQRERWKLEQYRAIYRVLENSVLVHERHLAGVFERITKLDRDDYFKNPVSKAEVPDYFDVIQNPMCWAMIEKKLEHHEYWDINAFRDDIELVLDNAMLYNRSGTMHHRAATRIKHAVHPIIEELRQTVGAIVPSDPNEEDSIGDLEPPLELLELLFSAEAIQDELDLVLDDGPLASLLEFTLPKLKPPPPPPPKQPKAKRSSKSKKKQAKGAATAAGHGLPVEPEQGVVEEPMEEGQETTEVLEEQQSAIDETFEDASTVSISAAPKSRKRTGGKPAPSVSTAGSATSAIDTSKRGTRGTTSRASGKVAPSAVEDSQNPSGTQISARDSFSMFNIGWILPSDEKRGGRKSVDRSAIPPPPPRKRMRTGPGPSRLSIVDTAPADSQPVSETAGPVDESVPDDAPGPVVELPETSAEGPLQDNIVPSSIEPASEEISTATPQLDIAPHQQPSPPQDEHTEPFSAPTPVTTAKDTRTSVPPPVHALAPESTPAVVTDGTVPEPEGIVKRRKKAKGGRQPVGDDVVDPDNVLVQPGQNLDGGTIVWAQATSYPWWPGVIWDPTHWQTPVNLKTQLEKANRNSETSSYIVQFFDKHKTWQILSHKQLRMLGEDKDFDADLVAEKSKRQWVGWTAKNMQACRASYEIALNEMETPSDVENAAKLATEVVVDANPLPKDVEQVAE
ncbi:hypothetical protein H0H93_002746 [Arthromyces matolae]|nr:hypothetical protein H0H93_002746 [Arthromyces matolae]